MKTYFLLEKKISKQVDPTNSVRLITEVNSRACLTLFIHPSESFQQPQAHTQELFIKSILGDLYCQDVQ